VDFRNDRLAGAVVNTEEVLDLSSSLIRDFGDFVPKTAPHNLTADRSKSHKLQKIPRAVHVGLDHKGCHEWSSQMARELGFGIVNSGSFQVFL
jgi:hypothetical protein